jgi:L-asparaginase
MLARMSEQGSVRIRGTVGPDDAEIRLLLLYTGGTIGMVAGPSGALEPLDLTHLPQYLPVLNQLPMQLTVAAFDHPFDSAAAHPEHWLAIADFIVAQHHGHAGVVVLHGTDTMAYTASALSFLLDGLSLPIVFTGAQRPVTSLRSDGRENIVAAAAIAAMRGRSGAAAAPEVTVFFDDVLLRGNRATKVHAERYHAFDSPNFPPLGRAGVTIQVDEGAVRPAGVPPLRRRSGVCADVASLRLHPGLDAATLRAVLGRPGLKGLVLETFGGGNGPTAPWFVHALRAATDAGLVIVGITQCPQGSVDSRQYVTGTALLDAGVVAGYDLTFEAAITKLMVLLDTHGPDETRTLVATDLAGELTR